MLYYRHKPKTEDKIMAYRYFKVTAKCGHVGRNNCIWITFATMADNGKDAASKVRNFKRVKHDHKDAIRSVEEISFVEFINVKAQNDRDPYLHCKNRQEQRKIPDFEQRVTVDPRNNRTQNPKKDRSHRRIRVMLGVQEAEQALKSFRRIGECA